MKGYRRHGEPVKEENKTLYLTTKEVIYIREGRKVEESLDKLFGTPPLTKPKTKRK